MQTFMPSPYFKLCAETLDDRRLGKQRVEAFQILQTLVGVTKGWQHHPAVKMWRDHEPALVIYGAVMCSEWRRRGFEDNMGVRFRVLLQEHVDIKSLDVPIKPPWLGNMTLHLSHQAALFRKDPEHYSQYEEAAAMEGLTCCPGCNYYWPTHDVRLSPDDTVPIY